MSYMESVGHMHMYGWTHAWKKQLLYYYNIVSKKNIIIYNGGSAEDWHLRLWTLEDATVNYYNVQWGSDKDWYLRLWTLWVATVNYYYVQWGSAEDCSIFAFFHSSTKSSLLYNITSYIFVMQNKLENYTIRNR